VTIAKWDIAWSDYFRADTNFRRGFAARDEPEPILDDFEQALASLLGADISGAAVRRRGVQATLLSELVVPGATGRGAAALGHLAEDVLPAQLSVWHTLLTAHVRANCGDVAYRELLGALDGVVDGAGTGIVDAWLLALCIGADSALSTASSLQPVRLSLRDAVTQWQQLQDRRGWDAARDRAAAAEAALCRVADQVRATLDVRELELLLRGSLAQDVVGRRSDVDFELSSPSWPHGHAGAEALVVRILAACGIPAEGSDARPTEADLTGRDTSLTRDLHEWMELRGPGSPWHNPGWVASAMSGPSAITFMAPSVYERRGRELSAKYLWFEVRAAVARMIFGSMPAGCPIPVDLELQLDRLPALVGEPIADETRSLVGEIFALREQPTAALDAAGTLARRLDALRSGAGLPGATDGGSAS
jgi:hypothetical protein